MEIPEKKTFQNHAFKLASKDTELLPTMAHCYNITGHVTRKGA